MGGQLAVLTAAGSATATLCAVLWKLRTKPGKKQQRGSRAGSGVRRSLLPKAASAPPGARTGAAPSSAIALINRYNALRPAKDVQAGSDGQFISLLSWNVLSDSLARPQRMPWVRACVRALVVMWDTAKGPMCGQLPFGPHRGPQHYIYKLRPSQPVQSRSQSLLQRHLDRSMDVMQLGPGRLCTWEQPALPR
jgi:hypothetical protein